MNLKSIFAIARITVIEQIRNRLYLVILFFGAVILVSSLLVGSLAPGFKIRVIFDLGLLSLEVFGLATAIFGAVSLVLQEVESKTIYLILTRPVKRPTYILGRFLGLVMATIFTMVSMAVLHLLILMSDWFRFQEFTQTMSFWSIYPTLVLMSVGKMFVTASVALFFSLFATSQVSALVFTGCFWIAGHFGPELDFMIQKAVNHNAARWIIHAVAALLPNFQYFNFRDLYATPHFAGYQFMGAALLYGLAYSGFFLCISSILFSRKEF